MNSSIPSSAYSATRSATSVWLPTSAVPAPPRTSPTLCILCRTPRPGRRSAPVPVVTGPQLGHHDGDVVGSAVVDRGAPQLVRGLRAAVAPQDRADRLALDD